MFGADPSSFDCTRGATLMARAPQYAPRAENSALIRAALIDLWARGQSVAFAAVETYLAAKRTPLSRPTIATQVQSWKLAGLAETTAAPRGTGERLHTLRLGGQKTATATLRTVVEFALTPASEFPSWARANLRTALRLVLELPAGADLPTILAAAAAVPPARLRDLPERLLTLAAARGLTRRVATNLESVLRRALRCAAEHNQIPLVFVVHETDAAWDALRWKFFGADSKVPLRSRPTYRRAFTRFWQHITVVLADPIHGRPNVTFEEITPTDMALLKRHLRRSDKAWLYTQIQHTLRWIGKTHGAGPYGGATSSSTDAVYLTPANRSRKAGSLGSWPALIALFGEHGFGPEWLEFLAWYRDYSTLSDADLAANTERFPVRPTKRHLAPGTVVLRHFALRAWCGMARIVLNKHPADLTLQDVFGDSARLIGEKFKTWWAARADGGEVTDATSGGLTSVLLSAAMVARALCDRAAHQLGARAATGKAASLLEWEHGLRTSEEEAYFRGYQALTAQAEQLEEKRKTSESGHVHTTAKDVVRMIRQTPPQWWQQVLDAMLADVQAGVARGRTGKKFFRLVSASYLLGFVISTGLRRSELAHVRIGAYVNRKGERVDRQYGPRNRAARVVKLRAVDRKNRRQHIAGVRERFCPLWLEALYLDTVRPFFLAKGRQEHDWLFVNGSGAPYGCINETDSGQRTAEDMHRSTTRKLMLTKTFQQQVASAAARIGLPLPDEIHEFGFHAVRNVFAFLLFQTPGLGVTAAANWLGDRTQTVEGTYAEVDGTLVDLSACRDLVFALPTEVVAANGETAETASDAPRGVSSTPSGETTEQALMRLLGTFTGRDVSTRQLDLIKAVLTQ
jgi:integrase